MIVTPIMPTLPIKIDQREVMVNGEKMHSSLVLNRLTGPTNLIGFPSLSMPCGISLTGLPIGLQLIGKPFDEANMYRFGEVLERELSLKNLI